MFKGVRARVGRHCDIQGLWACHQRGVAGGTHTQRLLLFKDPTVSCVHSNGRHSTREQRPILQELPGVSPTGRVLPRAPEILLQTTLEGADSPAAYPQNGSGEDSAGAVGPMLEGFRDLLWTEEVTGEPPRGPGYVLWPIGGAQEQEEPALSRPLEAFGATGANQPGAGFTSQEEVPDRGLEGVEKPREVPGGH